MTPYEKLKGKKPSVDYLKVFGCMAYAKINTRLKKLDDRCMNLVYIGAEKGSKSFRLFDPIKKILVISRDVAFDENKKWSWKKSSDEQEALDPGYFWVDLHGILDTGVGQTTMESTKNGSSTENIGSNQVIHANSPATTTGTVTNSDANTASATTVATNSAQTSD